MAARRIGMSGLVATLHTVPTGQPRSWPVHVEPRKEPALATAISREELGPRRILALIPRSRASRYEFKRAEHVSRQLRCSKTHQRGRVSLGYSPQAHSVREGAALCIAGGRWGQARAVTPRDP